VSAARSGLGAVVLAASALLACSGKADPSGSGGGTGGGGSTGSGGEGGGGNPFQGCPGVALSADGALDLDIKSVDVKGKVTLSGAPLPDAGGDRGRLIFRDKAVVAVGLPAEFALGSSGAGEYAVRLPPGTYDVLLAANTKLCQGGKAPVMPCVGGLVKGGVAIGSDGVLDLDIPVATLQGKVTLNGAAFPSPPGGSRGQLGFHSAANADIAFVDLGDSGPASYAVTVVQGAGSVSFHGNLASCGGQSAQALPCNAGEVVPSRAITQSGALDIDIAAVSVQGAVTVNGKPMPSAGSSRGSISFSIGPDWVYNSPQLGSSGAASYATTLLKGTYRVGLAANEGLCNGAAAPDVPCVSGPIKPSVALSANGVLDVDLPVVKVSGAVKLASAALPDQPASRGSVVFTLADGGAVAAPLGATGAKSYALTLLKGTYAVGYRASTALCNGVTAPEMPCVDGPLRAPLPLADDGVLDLEIDRIKVSGDVKLAGGPLPDEANERGRLAFSLQGGGLVEIPLGASGPVKYAITLLPGTYQAALDADAGLCAPGASPKVPCIGGPLRAPLAITSDGVLDIDIPVVRVSGNLTLNGGPLPSVGAALGQLGFTRLDQSSPALLPAAPGSYTVTLVPGAYVIEHMASPTACEDAAGSKIPCAPQVLRGCEGRAP
jgi:hypothetical protein